MRRHWRIATEVGGVMLRTSATTTCAGATSAAARIIDASAKALKTVEEAISAPGCLLLC